MRSHFDGGAAPRSSLVALAAAAGALVGHVLRHRLSCSAATAMAARFVTTATAACAGAAPPGRPPQGSRALTACYRSVSFRHSCWPVTHPCLCEYPQGNWIAEVRVDCDLLREI